MDKINFADRLVEAIQKKGNAICVGLDPRLDKIPEVVKGPIMREAEEQSPMRLVAEMFLEFNKGIIDAVADIVPVVKPQIAFYEVYGPDGIWAYQETIRYAQSKGLLVIADVKRNDIGTTAEAYASAYLGEINVLDDVVMPVFGADSLTINPYLGWDGVKPFIEEADNFGGGVFVMVKTSNSTSGDLQDLQVADGNRVFEVVAQYVDSWGSDYIGESGYSLLGAVVGATYPSEAKILRRLMPNAFFLVPGYGAQGGSAEDVKPCFNRDGLGALVNSSRGIIFAYERMEYDPAAYAEAARAAVLEMKNALDIF